MAADDEARPPLAVRIVTSPPTAEAFIAEHVKPNLPLIIRGAASHWAAMHWSADSLTEEFGQHPVTVAPLHRSGPHAHLDKWLEDSSLWEHDEPEPKVCDTQKLLVVSGVRVNMRLKKFMRMMHPDSTVEAGFYADGAGNLGKSFPFLKRYFEPPPFATALDLKRADLWIGGKSISRMHYDNLDNVFAQVVGRKTFVLSPPHEGAKIQGGKRLRKAACKYTHPGQFTRDGGGVLHETVLNYLGVEREATALPTVSVTLEAGDMLYLPFGWWHEVHSHPDGARGHMCASVSHFYTPYYCRLGGRTCSTLGPLMVNPAYDEGRLEKRLGGGSHERWRGWRLALGAVAVAAVATAALLAARRGGRSG